MLYLLFFAPAGTVSVNCVITVAGCLLAGGDATGNATHRFTIPYNDVEIPAQVFHFPVPMPQGSLVITAARLEYSFIKNGMVTVDSNPAFMPASVLNARYV